MVDGKLYPATWKAVGESSRSNRGEGDDRNVHLSAYSPTNFTANQSSLGRGYRLQIAKTDEERNKIEASSEDELARFGAMAMGEYVMDVPSHNPPTLNNPPTESLLPISISKGHWMPELFVRRRFLRNQERELPFVPRGQWRGPHDRRKQRGWWTSPCR